MTDVILVSNLAVRASIGVPDAERAEPQRLLVSLALTPRRAFDAMGDEVAHTIDYAAVCERVKVLAAARARKLIETLASDVAEMILAEFACARVEVEVRKFILPETEHVAVRLTRIA